MILFTVSEHETVLHAITEKVDGYSIRLFDVRVVAGTACPHCFVRAVAFVVKAGTAFANLMHCFSPFLVFLGVGAAQAAPCKRSFSCKSWTSVV